MKKQAFDAIRLGIFVLTGLVVLIVALYMLSRNRSFFGNRLELTTHFRDINGLLVGNNVRFNGIDVGNVRSIKILNDTTIEVFMSMKKDMKTYIRKNVVASIGTDGLIGNRIINLSPGDQMADFVEGGELINSIEEVDTESMLRTLDRTNQNIGDITDEILLTLQLIRKSSELNRILNDSSLSTNLSLAFANLKETTVKANTLASNAIQTLKTVTEGTGTIATLLTDTSMAGELKRTIGQLRIIETNANKVLQDLNQSVNQISKDIQNENGALHTILKDSISANRLKRTLENIEKGTASFAEDMEALQSNFLLRPYFKKKEKEERKKLKKDSAQ